MSNWKTAKYFTDSFISVGTWDLTRLAHFPKRTHLGADTETKLYHNNKLIDDNEAYTLYKENGQSWFKENIEVRPYAFMLSDGESFALFQNADDFLTACAMFHVKLIFWYNAKFDFAIFDYFMLTHGWQNGDDRIKSMHGRYGKLPDKTYQSLNGDFGQRYAMRIWKGYKDKNSHIKVHNFKMIDICNIYGGGLAKNLEDWKITDREGNDVRKLEMDYTEASVDEDLQYMINDTKGLYLLAEKIDKTIFEISGYSLFKGDYITAGGLAKKTLLQEMFKQGNPNENVQAFKEFFPITINEDEDFRSHKLYLGGKCLVNPYKLGSVERKIYKYDVNSMYPDKMRNMDYPLGKGKRIANLKLTDNKHLYIVSISRMTGIVKHDMIPIWQDTLTGEYVDVIEEDRQLYIWLEELRELENWYELDYKVDFVLEYEIGRPKGTVSYVDKFYTIKCNSKGAIKNGAKLFLNSAYGKIAQRVERVQCRYELSPQGYVHLVKGDTEIDEKSMLSVVVGSRITSLARVHLMQYIRTICKGNVQDNFIYCDTDSVHALVPYEDTDDKELGKMKCEGIYEYGLYIAPKTYLMFDGEHYEVHCKGVNIAVVSKELYKENQPIPFSEAINVFRPNRPFKCLCGLNVVGGKALVLVDKVILNDDNFEIATEKLGDLEDVTDYIY